MTGSEKLLHHIKTWAEKKGDASCIVETDTDANLTYNALWQHVQTMRTYLGSEQKCLMVSLPGGILTSVLWIAALSSGHTLIPISPKTTTYEVEALLKKYSVDIIIADLPLENIPGKLTVLTAAACGKVLHNGAPAAHRTEAIPARDGTVLLFSSGSTGEPKGMKLTTTQILLTADAISESHILTEHDRGLTPLPFHHVNAPVVSLMSTIVSGGCVIIAPKFSISNFWSWVERYDPTWISIVPTIVSMLLSTERPSFLDTASVRFVRTASAPLPVSVLKRFEEKFKLPLVETYGISEAASTIAANPVPPGVHKPGSVGYPIGVTLKIFHRSDTELVNAVPAGTVGEICIRGENVISRYEKGAGEHSFKNGWFRTGDMGYLDEDGYLFITGRIKDIIIRGGENIAPREIEEVLLMHPQVHEVAVVGKDDSIYGEMVVAYIVTKNISENTPAIISSLESFAASHLSPEKVPSVFHVLKELPRGRTGKIDKQALRTSPDR